MRRLLAAWGSVQRWIQAPTAHPRPAVLTTRPWVADAVCWGVRVGLVGRSVRERVQLAQELPAGTLARVPWQGRWGRVAWVRAVWDDAPSEAWGLWRQLTRQAPRALPRPLAPWPSARVVADTPDGAHQLAGAILLWPATHAYPAALAARLAMVQWPHVGRSPVVRALLEAATIELGLPFAPLPGHEGDLTAEVLGDRFEAGAQRGPTSKTVSRWLLRHPTRRVRERALRVLGAAAQTWTGSAEKTPTETCMMAR